MKLKSLLEWRKRAFKGEKEPERFRMKVFAKLKKLEEQIPKLKAKRREEAMETYRELLWLLKDEPVFLIRYE